MENELKLEELDKVSIKELSTKELFHSIKTIATCNNLILKGTFPGVAFLEVKMVIEWLTPLYEKYYSEFFERKDADLYEPNIRKVGSASLKELNE